MIKLPNLVKYFKRDPVCSTVLLMLSIFIVTPVGVPSEIAKLVDTSYGMLSIVLLAIYFLCKNPLMGVVLLIAGCELIKRSRGFGRTIRGGRNFIPSEKKKYNKMRNINNFPYTVEELVINSTVPYSYNMVDNVRYDDSANNTHFAEKV